jgi:ABC-type branched-subunit amino acid transport system permease subunit
MMRFSIFTYAAIGFVALAAGAIVLPDWAMFLFAMALAKGLVCLGIVGMMRGGVVSFGQGLYYCLGAYTATLAANFLGVSDIFLLTLLSAAVCLLVGLIFGPLLSSYRGIFFAMLSLALSMVLYGSLSKMSFIGGTDGLNIGAPTFLGWAPEGRPLQTALYLYVVTIVVISGALMRCVLSILARPCALSWHTTMPLARSWAGLVAPLQCWPWGMWTPSLPFGRHQVSLCL